jgi:hypothetical protein
MTTPLNRSLATTSSANPLFALFLNFHEFVFNEFVTLTRRASECHRHCSDWQAKNCTDRAK